MADIVRRVWVVGGLLAACVLLCGCADPNPAPAGFERVTIDGTTFTLELAADGDSRVQGLSGRDSIPEDGGMLFVFPQSQLRYFVMRDCFVPIDIIFLDGAGRVTMTHAMLPEPRQEGEGEVGEMNAAYEARLKRYTSRFSAQFAIELKGGMLETLDVSSGDQIDLDTERLRRLAK